MLASTIVVLEIARLGMRDGLKSGLQTLCGCPCSKTIVLSAATCASAEVYLLPLRKLRPIRLSRDGLE